MDDSIQKVLLAHVPAVVSMMILAVLGWKFLLSSDLAPRRRIVESAPVTESDVQPASTVPVQPNSVADHTDRLLDQIQADLKNLNDQTMPLWESKIERLLDDFP